MSTIDTSKKLELLDQDIQATKKAQSRYQEKVAAHFLEAISKTKALTLNFPTFMGGVLEVIAKIEEDAVEGGEWRQAGEKFLKRLSSNQFLAPKAKTSVETNGRA